MAKTIQTEIRINATPEKVWAVLTDFNAFAKWNPFIKSLTGDVKTGNTIKVRLEPPGAKGMTFKPKVLAFEKNSRFHWQGHLFFPGLFDGRHRFELTANGDGTTTFIHAEDFKGILVPLLRKMLDINTRNGFLAMNTALKERAEK